MIDENIFLQKHKTEDQLKEIFGKIVVRQRKALGLTQEQLADQCGVSKQLISKIENGHSIVNLDLLLKLIHILKIDFDEISNLFFEIPLKMNRNQKYLIDKVKDSSFLTKEEVKTISDFIDLLKKGKTRNE